MILNRLRELLPKRKTKEQLDEHYENMDLEKGDFLAMCIAALITFLPILIIALVVIFGLTWLILGG